MAFTYGFYNSVNGDRKYSAAEFSAIFNGIINDGVFISEGDKLMVSEGSGMVVGVGTGRAWLRGTWNNNDTVMNLTVTDSELALDRIDTVVLVVNSDPNTRENKIIVKKGTPSATPSAPSLINLETLRQYPLADIYVAAGVTEITQGNITNRVGTTDLPYVTGILETMDISALVAQWEGQWDTWSLDKEVEFIDWFDNLDDQLSENQASNLQSQINAINADKWKEVWIPAAGITPLESAPCGDAVIFGDYNGVREFEDSGDPEGFISLVFPTGFQKETNVVLYFYKENANSGNAKFQVNYLSHKAGSSDDDDAGDISTKTLTAGGQMFTVEMGTELVPLFENDDWDHNTLIDFFIRRVNSGETFVGSVYLLGAKIFYKVTP
jgi:hypothetical protein